MRLLRVGCGIADERMSYCASPVSIPAVPALTIGLHADCALQQAHTSVCIDGWEGQMMEYCDSVALYRNERSHKAGLSVCISQGFRRALRFVRICCAH